MLEQHGPCEHAIPNAHTDTHTDTHTESHRNFFRDFEDFGPGGALGPVRPPSSSISQRMDEEYGGDNAYAGTFKSTPHGMDTNGMEWIRMDSVKWIV